MDVEIDCQKINRMRLEKGILPKVMKEKTGISTAQIYRIIGGRQKRIFQRTAFSLMMALNCNLSDFVNEKTF